MKRGRLNAFLRSVKQVRTTIDDETAMTVGGLYPRWEADKEYEAGERVMYEGQLYRVLQAHTAQEGWSPDSASGLFAAVLPGQGGTEIGEWVQPDSTNPYMAGDRVIFNGQVYESTVDNNVWSPADYGWILVE